MVAAVAISDYDKFDLPVNDSKQLSEDTREVLAEQLKACPLVKYAIAIRDAEAIDRINILRATHEGMRESVLALPQKPDFALVDGLSVPNFPVPAQFIVKGDAKSASISAASILAKTVHDTILRKLDEQFPGYNFSINKGYGTADHLAALKRLGPCPAHRKTFGPVRDLNQQELF